MKTRIYFLDNLRTFLIFLVVVLHAGLVYESVLENTWIVCDPVKNNSIGLIRMYLNLFVMFSIFFISGYFVPRSLSGKTSFGFVKAKFKRIMLPWIIAVVTLIPAYKAIFLFSRGLPQEEWFSYFHFFERVGSDLSMFSNNLSQNWLWFLPVLFLFQVLYLAMSKMKLLSFNLSVKTGVIITFVTGVIYSMIISVSGIKGWTHSFLLDFERERVLIYFMSFLLGSLCYKRKVFESDIKNNKLYILSNVVLAISMTLFTIVALNLFFNIIDPGRNYYYISEHIDKLVYYITALLLMFSFLHILIHSFRYSLNKTNRILQELNKSSYSVYIIHTIVIGVIAIILLDFKIPVYIKFLILTTLTFVISNLLVYTYRVSLQKKVNVITVTTILTFATILGIAFDSRSNIKTEIQNQEDTVSLQKVNIHEAVIKGEIGLVKQYIVSGENIDAKDEMGGSSPLISACVFGKTEIAAVLIEAGANVDFKNNDGSTPLHTAAFFCHTEIVKTLLSNGADITLRNNSGSTALESVELPFSVVEGAYKYFGETLEPLGLKLDMEYLKKTRTFIADIIRSKTSA